MAPKNASQNSLAARSAPPRRISLVIPAFNEAECIGLLRDRLRGFFDAAGEYVFDLTIVDDHSTDQTPELVRRWADEDPRVRLIRLSRNFGSHAAFHAGLAGCLGDAAVFLAADLQDPPEIIAEMITQWAGGSDVVWAVRTAPAGAKRSAKLFSRLYYRTLRAMGLAEMPEEGADFFLIDRKVIDAYLRIPEKNTSFMGMVLWMGFRQSFVPYVKQARARGISKWTLSKKVKLFVDSIVSFSFKPIRAMSLMGVGFALAGFVFALYVVIGRLAGWVTPGTGYAALMVVLLGGFGLIMLMLGVMGEYLWRTFDEARGRPRFIVEERYPPNAPGGASGESAE